MSFRAISVVWRSDIDANTFCIVCQRHTAAGALEKKDRIIMLCSEVGESKCVMGEWKDEEEYKAEVRKLKKEFKHAKLDAPSLGT